MNSKSLSMRASFLFLPLILVAVVGCQQGNDVTDEGEAVEEAAATPEAANTAEANAAETEVTEVEREQVDALITAYLDLRQSLANDQFEDVSAKMASIGEQAQPLTDSDNAEVQQLAQSLVEVSAANPEDVEGAREAYKAISTPVIELVKLVPPTDDVAETFYVGYCPMVKASWLQTSEELANPYMGEKMLRCGKVTETIPAGETL